MKIRKMDMYKEDYGQSIITCYARIDGWAVGIVANQRTVSKTKKGEKWSALTPSGVRVEGYLAPRVTAYPVYSKRH